MRTPPHLNPPWFGLLQWSFAAAVCYWTTMMMFIIMKTLSTKVTDQLNWIHHFKGFSLVPSLNLTKTPAVELGKNQISENWFISVPVSVSDNCCSTQKAGIVVRQFSRTQLISARDPCRWNSSDHVFQRHVLENKRSSSIFDLIDRAILHWWFSLRDDSDELTYLFEFPYWNCRGRVRVNSDHLSGLNSISRILQGCVPPRFSSTFHLPWLLKLLTRNCRLWDSLKKLNFLRVFWSHASKWRLKLQLLH